MPGELSALCQYGGPARDTGGEVYTHRNWLRLQDNPSGPWPKLLNPLGGTVDTRGGDLSSRERERERGRGDVRT